MCMSVTGGLCAKHDMQLADFTLHTWNQRRGGRRVRKKTQYQKVVCVCVHVCEWCVCVLHGQCVASKLS